MLRVSFFNISLHKQNIYTVVQAGAPGGYGPFIAADGGYRGAANDGIGFEAGANDESNLNYKPNAELAKALDVLFILHADRELNCSTSAMIASNFIVDNIRTVKILGMIIIPLILALIYNII